MGIQQAQEYAALENLDWGLSAHAESNHYPPLPQSLIPVWKEVIQWVNEGNSGDTLFKLPQGITYKGFASAPAQAIIENHHLVAWIQSDDETDF